MFVTLQRHQWDYYKLNLKRCGVLCSMLLVTFSLLLLLVFLATYAVNLYQKVNIVYVDLEGPVYKVDEKFLSITLDSSIMVDGLRDLNLTNDRLLALAKVFAPGYIRLGGTMADRLIFLKDGKDNVESNDIEFIEEYMDGGSCSYEGRLCEIRDHLNFTMNGKEWLQLNKFVNEAGLQLIFDLNVLIRYENGTWNYTNAESLITFSNDNNLSIHWELGNEPNSFRHQFDIEVNASQLAKDFTTLKKILIKYPNYKNSLLIGPDTTRPRIDHNQSILYMKEFLDNAGHLVDAITWHQYYFNGRLAKPEDFINPKIMDFLKWEVAVVKNIAHWTNTSNKPIWLGETSSAYGGGAPCLSDRFIASFIWLDKLGMSARLGIDVVMRQSFIRGSYALVTNCFNPNPDWWVSVLYKRLVGQKVLPCYTASSPKVRLYCHCSSKNFRDYEVNYITVFGMNLDNSDAKIRIEGIHPMNTNDASNLFVYSYILTAQVSLFSKNVLLNGKLLKMTCSDDLPVMKPKIVAAHPYVELPAYAIGFWVIPASRARQCANY